MTADKFRKLALEIEGAIESSHMGHADFRLAGRVFASLGYPDVNHGMVKLSLEKQSLYLKQAPKVFARAAGAWGKQGSTILFLPRASVEVVRAGLVAASQNVRQHKPSNPRPRRGRGVGEVKM